jgi:hypothetical protein
MRSPILGESSFLQCHCAEKAAEKSGVKKASGSSKDSNDVPLLVASPICQVNFFGDIYPENAARLRFADAMNRLAAVSSPPTPPPQFV